MPDLASELSANELRLLAAAWISCETPPKPNYEVIAQICGYKNAGSASVMYGGVKRKLAAAAERLNGTGGESTTAQPTPDSTAPKTAGNKSKRVSINNDEAGPKKRSRKGKTKSPAPDISTEDTTMDLAEKQSGETFIKKEHFDDEGPPSDGEPEFFKNAMADSEDV